MLLLLLLLGSAWAVQCDAQELRIPRLIHRNYMAGVAALQAATAGPQPDFKAHWLASCMTHHPGWQEVIWDEASVLSLIQQDFPWFLPTYLSYSRLVQRSDVMRYLVLYKYGGVYLDADVECFTNMEQSLWGLDLVLSCEEPGAWGQLHNAAMASIPGHPFWLAVLQEVMRRSPAAAAVQGSWTARQLRKLWLQSPFYDRIADVLQTTGPVLLTESYQSYTGGAPACGHSLVVNGLVSTAYPVGAWFTPCLCGDDECARHWMTQHFNLVALQQQGESVQVVSQWLRNKIKHQQRKQWQQKRQYQMQQTRQQQHQQTLKAASIQEVPPQQQHVVGIHHYSASWTGWDQSHRSRYQQEMREEMSQHVLSFLQHSALPLQRTHNSTVTGGSLPLPLDHDELLRPGGAGSCTVLSVLGAPVAASSSTSVQSGTLCNSSSTANSEEGPCIDTSCGPNILRCPVVSSSGSSSSSNFSEEDLLCGAADTECMTAPMLGVLQHSWQTEELFQQLSCNITVVSPYAPPAWAAGTEASSSQSAAVTTGLGKGGSSSGSGGGDSSSGSGVHPVQGILHVAARQNALGSPAWTLSDLLQHSSAEEENRHILRFSCNGCEIPVLQQLFALPWGRSSVLDQVRVLYIDLAVPAAATKGSKHSGSQGAQAGGSSDGPANALIPGLDEVFILLHQQLGFKLFWRQNMSNGVLQLGWVRQPVAAAAAAARMAAPHAEHAAAALNAAAANTARAELLSVACNCCHQCCSGPAAGSGRGWLRQGCPMWQRAACQLFGSLWPIRSCSVVHPVLDTATCHVTSMANDSAAADVTTCASSVGCGSGCCVERCACARPLWGLLQGWVHLTWLDGSRSPSSDAWSVCSVLVPILTLCAVLAPMGLLVHTVHSGLRAKRAAQAKNASVRG